MSHVIWTLELCPDLDESRALTVYGDNAIPIAATETVLEYSQQAGGSVAGALVVDRSAVAPAAIDDADEQEKIAEALARELVREVLP